MITVPQIVFAALGVVLVVVGIVLPRVPPNSVLGVRTTQTRSDPAAWRRANRTAGRGLILLGALTFVLSPFVPVRAEMYVLLIGLAAVSLVAVWPTRPTT
jgi:uncharacterized membrane protein